MNQANGEKVFSGFEDLDDNYAILETDQFRDQNGPHDKRTDHSHDGHGTQVASKIIGQWGLAKVATLVPVQTKAYARNDLPQGFNRVWRDFARRRLKNRGLQAVSDVFMKNQLINEYVYMLTPISCYRW
jgi:hypothetical protein